MNKLYQKSEICFAIMWIVIYIVGTSLVEGMSQDHGFNKIPTFVFHVVITIVILSWLRRKGLCKEYGLCRANSPASKFIYYIPLLIIASCNLWLGLTMNFSITESVFYAGSMICVGFIEEIIFRGFLFKAMAKDSIKVAIIVSSVTFGIGHVINLLNGNSDDPLATICQIFYATAVGFLFVILFYRGGTLWPCIITHSVVNAMSVFADESNMTDDIQIITSIILTLVSVAYAVVLMKRLPVANGCDYLQEKKNE